MGDRRLNYVNRISNRSGPTCEVTIQGKDANECGRKLQNHTISSAQDFAMSRIMGDPISSFNGRSYSPAESENNTKLIYISIWP